MEQIQAQILEDERAQRQITNENGQENAHQPPDDSSAAEENKLLQISMRSRLILFSNL